MMAEPYFERLENQTGLLQFVQVQQPIPGHTYYFRRQDEQNQIFYTTAQNPIITTVPPQAHPQAQFYTNTSPHMVAGQPMMVTKEQQPLMTVGPDYPEIASANGLHLGITVTSLFLPTLIYLIGYPFCYNRLRRLSDIVADTDPHVRRWMKTYAGVGWTAWVLHLATLIALCSFWIPECRYDHITNTHACGLPGIPALIGVVILTTIFTITTVVLGATLVRALQCPAMASSAPLANAPYQTFVS